MTVTLHFDILTLFVATCGIAIMIALTITAIRNILRRK